MGVELRPLGVACNISCVYCYQQPQRDAGNIAKRYDIEAMKAAVEREGGPFTLFGGEPLLLPTATLEDLWSWGKEKYGRNGVQTNGSLITDDHIRLFREYDVQVGISIDGPGELNAVRWAGSDERTDSLTEKSEAAIHRLCREGIPPSLIITLHRGNATEDKLHAMFDWIRHLDAIGVSSTRLHLMEAESPLIRAKLALSTERNVQALIGFAELEQSLSRMRFDTFDDMEKMLSADDLHATCVWKACDPLTTDAVRGVEGFGQSSNCGRTNKDGIDYIKSDGAGFERYLSLYHTPHENGGCKGCRFFLMCKGQCPGTAIDGDWRNRTEHCEIWFRLFQLIEQRMARAGTRPISLDDNLPTSKGTCFANGQRVTTPGSLMYWLACGRSINARGTQAMPNESSHLQAQAMTMERLDFALHDFVRMSWVSDEAKRGWQHRISRVNTMHSFLEWASVASGLRRCSLQMLDVRQFDERAATLRSHKLQIQVLKEVQSNRSYQSRINEVTSGDTPALWCVIGSPESCAEFREAFEQSNNITMGQLLGYPRCCTEFFQRFWVDEALIDPTWPNALNASTSQKHVDACVVSCKSSGSSVHLRWIGVRPVFHLPCSNDCLASRTVATDLSGVAREFLFTDESDWLAELISMPAEWSALHGIAEIKTPLFKIVTNTDATARKYVVRLEGDYYPTEGASGLAFPFRIRNKESHREVDSLNNVVTRVASIEESPVESAEYEGNGFTSKYGMDRAHSPLVAECLRVLSSVRPEGGKIVDLGCGNGVLLRKIATHRADLAVAGIDLNRSSIERAIKSGNGQPKHFVSGDMFDVDMLTRRIGSNIDVCIVMLGRLSEVETEKAQRLLEWLSENVSYVLVYCYADYGKSLQVVANTLGVLVESITETDTVTFGTLSKKEP
ncbi:MAG: radical SAM protein [Pirellulales bacterium]|nr:radical SAM protein [Pirellulales bacterium]